MNYENMKSAEKIHQVMTHFFVRYVMVVLLDSELKNDEVLKNTFPRLPSTI